MGWDLELPSIGGQLFVLGSSQSDSTAFSSLLDTYATRLLTEPLNIRCIRTPAEKPPVIPSDIASTACRFIRYDDRCKWVTSSQRRRALIPA